MRTFLFCAALAAVMAGGAVFGADVYQWVDENGIRRYSNQPPPEGANVIERTEEHAYDEEADRQRRKKDAAEWEKMQQRLEAERKRAEERRQKEQLQEALEKQRAQQKKIEALEKKVDTLQKENRRSAIIVLPQPPARPTPLPGAAGPH